MCSAVVFGASASAQVAHPAAGYRGALKWYIADLKASFPEQRQFYSEQTALTDANYKSVLRGLKNNARFNGIRLPIFPAEVPAQYSATYKNVVLYARAIGLVIYASPLSVGGGQFAGWSNDQYVHWLADYANYYKPQFLSPFNESGFDNQRIREIVLKLRPLISPNIELIGPDKIHLQNTLQALAQNDGTASLFDIVSSHNANQDNTANSGNWNALVRLASGERRQQVWSSENPRDWGRLNGLPGMGDAVGGGVQGVVVWLAKPGMVDDNGRPTPKALDIASHIAVGGSQ